MKNDGPVALTDSPEAKAAIEVSADGSAIVSASVFDDGSEDNCGIDYFEVKRMVDIDFNDWVSFYCFDVGNPVMVIMRVWDISGNSS